jgi:hypothetical protein
MAPSERFPDVAGSVMVLSLAKDQTEINRIIADVSKGSKFYEVWRLKNMCIMAYLLIANSE